MCRNCMWLFWHELYDRTGCDVCGINYVIELDVTNLTLTMCSNRCDYSDMNYVLERMWLFWHLHQMFWHVFCVGTDVKIKTFMQEPDITFLCEFCAEIQMWQFCYDFAQKPDEKILSWTKCRNQMLQFWHTFLQEPDGTILTRILCRNRMWQCWHEFVKEPDLTIFMWFLCKKPYGTILM
jgi:hypothetical protein